MTDRTPDAQHDALQARRAATLRSIVELAQAHGLQIPPHVHMFDDGTVQMRMDNEDYAGVAAWGAALDLGPIRAEGVPRATCDFVSVRAERRYDTDSGWIGWTTIGIWSACWRDMPVRDDAAGGAA